jgi:GDPmannose 4,6-dehydratase
VIATGETHSVREFLEEAFKCVGIENGIEKYVKRDEKFVRPSEVDLLVGDSTKAREVLGWVPRVSFRELVQIMIENDLRIEKQRLVEKN